jgi:hypothetical protein
MLSLAESNDRQLAEFLNSTAVTREKERVILHLAYPSARLVQMTQTLRAQVEARPVNRPPTIAMGKKVDEWGADGVAAPAGTSPGELSWRTVDKVQLVNNATITVGRALNGGKNARFDRVEIVPAEGAGAPLIFRTEHMRNVRGAMWQFQFPGADGAYTLKIAYMSDPEGKAKYALSVNDPKPAAPVPQAPR